MRVPIVLDFAAAVRTQRWGTGSQDRPGLDHVTVVLDEDGPLKELVVRVPRGRVDMSPDAAGQRCLDAVGLEGL